MTAPSSSARRSVLKSISTRAPSLTDMPKPATNGNGTRAYHKPTSDFFGCNTFGARQMRSKLPRETYQKLVDAIRHGQNLDLGIAPTVAQVIKEWAIGQGVTHFTHWFLPQTGQTAEKHDAFLTFDENGVPIEAFSAAQLI